MKYNLLTKELDEIKDIISLNEKILNNLNGVESSLYKKAAHKNITISIYTFWENYCKELIYSYYENYKKIILNKRFLINYFQHVQEKPYTRKLFINSIDENKINITKENLCHSNNLSFEELKSLFKRIMFNIGDFEKHMNDFPKLEDTVNQLQIQGIAPIYKGNKVKYNVADHVEGYLNLIVENRNSVSHQYEIVEIYNSTQFELILEFIRSLTLLIFEYCESQLIKKADIAGEKVYKRLFPIGVIKSNSGGNTAIIGIRNTSKRSLTKDTNLYYFDKQKSVYKILNIVKIVQDGEEKKEVLPLETYSLEVQTNAALKKTNNKFFICDLLPSSNEFEYPFVF